MDYAPTEKEIERLLKGRELIDGCKAVKAECIKVQINHDWSVAQAAKEKKGVAGHLDRDGIAITKAEAIIYRNDGLDELGFKRVEDFCQFNRQMVVAEVRFHMFKVVQVCDHCKGYKGIPPCKLTCGNNSWFKKEKNRMKNKTSENEPINIDLFFQWIQAIDYDKKGHSTLRYKELGHDPIAEKLQFSESYEYEKEGKLFVKLGRCPEGHGLISQYIAPARFSLHWTFDLMREVPRLHEYIKTNSR